MPEETIADIERKADEKAYERIKAEFLEAFKGLVEAQEEVRVRNLKALAECKEITSMIHRYREENDRRLLKEHLDKYVRSLRSFWELVKTDPDFLDLEANTLDVILALAEISIPATISRIPKNSKGGIVLPTLIEVIFEDEIKAAKAETTAAKERADALQGENDILRKELAEAQKANSAT
ncbi:MAG: hypothetical protein LBT59_21490 [Clostridiales bacterium]|nr:hypothetical protein [Clostridiales bacterium]